MRNFNPRSPCGERPNQINQPQGKEYFNPRSPCGERLNQINQPQGKEYFNPRSPCGERLILSHAARVAVKFQSTLPVWGAT